MKLTTKQQEPVEEPVVVTLKETEEGVWIYVSQGWYKVPIALLTPHGKLSLTENYGATLETLGFNVDLLGSIQTI